METRLNIHLYQNVHYVTKFHRLFFQKFKNDWSFALSGMVAFNLFIALLPMTILLFGIFGLILGSNVDLQNRIRTNVINIFPPKANDSLQEIINIALDKLHHDAGIILTVGILFSIIGCLNLCTAIDRSLTIVYRTDERKCLQTYLLAIKMLLIFVILIPLMIITSSIPSILLGVIFSISDRFSTYILGLISSLFVTFLLFDAIYIFIPNKKMAFQQTWCGAIIAASVLQVFMILFPLYVRNFMMSYTGQIGFTIMLILFIFYFALILIFGAQINAFFYENIEPLPVPLGTFINKFVQNYDRKIIEY